MSAGDDEVSDYEVCEVVGINTIGQVVATFHDEGPAIAEAHFRVETRGGRFCVRVVGEEGSARWFDSSNVETADQRLRDAERHAERLARRLAQNTDRDSLLGEVRRLRHEIDALNRYGENMRKFEARIKPERNRLHEAIQRIAAGPYSIEEARSIASAALQENDKGRKP